jgi:AcrR family transcriptional regulator
LVRTPSTALSESRRRLLLDTAGRHFAAHGFRGASLNAILAEAGVPKGVAYYYFADKADLLAAVLEEAARDLVAMVPAPGTTVTWEALRGLHRAHLALLRQRPWLAELARMKPPPEVAERLVPLYAPVLDLWPRMAAAGLLRQDLPDDLLFTMIRGLDDAVDRWWAGHPEGTEADADRAFEALRTLVAR